MVLSQGVGGELRPRCYPEGQKGNWGHSAVPKGGRGTEVRVLSRGVGGVPLTHSCLSPISPLFLLSSLSPCLLPSGPS